MLEYGPCCLESAAENAVFRFCPSCNGALLRCPDCGGLLTPLGACSTCLVPAVRVPIGLILREGAAADLPIEILNRGHAPFRLLRVSCRSGPEEQLARVSGLTVAPGQSIEVQVHLQFPNPGHFNLETLLELEWAHGSRIGFRGLTVGAIEVRPRLDGPLITAHSEGTGNLVNVSGLSSELLSEAIRSQGPSRAEQLDQSISLLAPEALDDFGDPSGIVSWATSLELPDMLVGIGTASARPRPPMGIVLGRNRPDAPSAAQELPATRRGTDLTLRFPTDHPRARELTMSISRLHWRLYPWAGSWWVEQLGASSSTLLVPGERARVLALGDRAPLPNGTQIFALGEQRDRLGFRMTHGKQHGRAVQLSRLQPF